MNEKKLLYKKKVYSIASLSTKKKEVYFELPEFHLSADSGRLLGSHVAVTI
jgi:hypothetical protein